jgi:hypothetical protein
MAVSPVSPGLDSKHEKVPTPSNHDTSPIPNIDNGITQVSHASEPPSNTFTTSQASGSDDKPNDPSTSNAAMNPDGSPTSSSTETNQPLSENRNRFLLIFITLNQLVQCIPLGAGINSGLAIGASLGASPVASVWVVAFYPLTAGTFVLIGGRLGEIYGHKTVLTAGSLWWVVWAFAGGYATSLLSVCLMRGLCGVGGGLMVPNIVALIGVTFPPGKRRNLGMALSGAMAPVGAAGGSLVAAVLVQLAHWKWLFFML